MITHRGASATEIDPYISTLFSPAKVLYFYSRWGKDPKHSIDGRYTFFEVSGPNIKSHSLFCDHDIGTGIY